MRPICADGGLVRRRSSEPASARAARSTWTSTPSRPTPPKEPLEKHYVSSAAAARRASWSSWPAMPRSACFATPTPALPRPSGPTRSSASSSSGSSAPASYPRELVFDSQLTTYAPSRPAQPAGHPLHDPAPPHPEDARRDLLSRPASAWRRITLRVPDPQLPHPAGARPDASPSRATRESRAPAHRRSIWATRSPRSSSPTTCKAGRRPLITRYAQRMLIENGIAEAIQFFHLDALSSMVGLKVDFDLQITLMGSALYRLLAQPAAGELPAGPRQDDLQQPARMSEARWTSTSSASW